MRPLKPLLAPCALLSCLFLFMVYSACRRLQDLPTNPLPHAAERFFTVPERTAPAFRQIAAGLRRLQERDHFVDDYVNRAGFPRWEFGQPGLNRSGQMSRASGGTDSLSYYYIPVTSPKTNSVTAILMVQVTGTDTLYRTLYQKQYSEFSRSGGAYSAQHLMALFFYFEQEIFNRHQFLILDSSLISLGRGSVPFPIRIATQAIPSPFGRLAWTICWRYPTPATCTCANSHGGRDCRDWWDPNCTVCGAEACITIVQGGDGGGGGGGGSAGGSDGGSALGWGPTYGGSSGDGSGGGGGGGGSNDPCRSFRTNIPAGCDPPGDDTPAGWEPIDEPDVPPPCDPFITDSLPGDAEFANRFKNLTLPGVTGLHYEKGVYVLDRSDNSYANVEGANDSPFIAFNYGIVLSGFLHSHYNGLNSVFSPDDVLSFAEAFLKGKARDSANFFFGMTSSYGDPMLMKVTNCAKFRAFAQKITKNEAIKKRFVNDYNNRFNFDNHEMNEIGFLKMMNEMGVNGGFSLYRGNADCNSWSKLSLSKDPLTNKDKIDSWPCN